MAVSTAKAFFECGAERVWDTVTSRTDYGWRRELDRIEVLSGTRFVEYTRDGYATTVTVTAVQPCRRWEFDLENSNMQGRCAVVLAQRDGGTEIELTEEAVPKRWWMMPLVKGYLRKQQSRYLRDLEQALLK